jgi:hypothetical protein
VFTTQKEAILKDYGDIKQAFLTKHIGAGLTEFELVRIDKKWRTIGKQVAEGRY